MNGWKKIDPKAITDNPFSLIGDGWMLITSGDCSGGGEKPYNTMTASWGGVGILWGKAVAAVYIRPQRFTFGYVEKNGLLTLSFFPEEYRKALSFCGANSGRDCDKASECGLTPVSLEGSTAFEEARLVLVCRKLYADDIKPERFLDPSCESLNYPKKDYHRMYICEILSVYRKE